MTGRVLVVDDSREARFARRRALERAGFEVTEATTGAECIAALEADGDCDLVVLDVNLPDIHGFEVCRRLREHPRARHLAVLQISSSSVDAQSQATSLEGGADAFLVEPVDAAVLVATARALLRLRQAEEAARQANHRLGLAQRAARTGVWDFAPKMDHLWLSREAVDVFGLSPDAQPTVSEWLSMIDERDRDRVAAALAAALDHEDRWDQEYRFEPPDGTARWIQAVGRFTRDGEGAADHASGIVLDVTERRRAQDRLRALQAATAAMSGALTPDDVIAAGMGAARELLEAESAAFGLVTPDGRRLRVGASGVSAALSARYPELPLDRAYPGPTSVLEGRRIQYATRAERLADFPASDMDAEHPNESCAWVPVIDERGPIGYIAVYDPAAHAFDEEALALLDSVARLASQALERAQLYERESTARATAELLNQVTEALEEEQDFTARLQRLLTALVPRIADFATVEALRPDGRLELLALCHRDPDLAEPLRRLREQYHMDVEAPVGIGHVIRTGSSQLIPDLDGAGRQASRDEAAERLIDILAPVSYIGVPLETHEGPVGALMLCTSSSGRRYGEAELTLADELAGRISLVLENARLYDEQRRIARTLQLGLLGGAHTRVDNVTLALRYQPGEGAAEIGGDWYDAFDRDDGTTVVAVGDVVGRGLRAATAMAKLRNGFRAFGLVRDGPGAILEELDRFAQTVEGGMMTTVACVVLDAATGRARYAAAGHPPPLLVSPDGHAHALMDGRSPPLLGDPSPRPEGQLTLPYGATIALYTDGVIERRGEPLDTGIARLEAEVTALADQPVGTQADRLLETMLRDQVDDDAALLLMRREDPAHPVLFRRVPAEPAVLGPLRASLRGWFARVALAEDDGRDLLLACSEAFNNAVEHAYGSMGSGELCLEARLIGDEAHISVRDFGHWRAPAVAGDRGRGSTLMQALCDAVEVIPTRTGTMVTLRRRVTADVVA